MEESAVHFVTALLVPPDLIFPVLTVPNNPFKIICAERYEAALLGQELLNISHDTVKSWVTVLAI